MACGVQASDFTSRPVAGGVEATGCWGAREEMRGPGHRQVLDGLCLPEGEVKAVAGEAGGLGDEGDRGCGCLWGLGLRN